MAWIKLRWKEVLLGLLILANIFVWHVVSSETRSGQLTVAFFNVGQGSSVFIEGPTGIQVLLDVGKGNKVLSELGKVMPFYDRSIDVVMTTGASAGEAGTLEDLLSRYEVLLPVTPVSQKNVGQRILLGDGATLTIKSAQPFRAQLDYGKDALLLGGQYPIEIDKKFYNPNFAGTVVLRIDGNLSAEDSKDTRVGGEERLSVTVEGEDRIDVLANARLDALLASVAGSVLEARSKTTDCKIRGSLPDPECTPGAVFPNASLAEICVSGYSKRVRKVSTSLKKRVYQEYSIPYPQKTGTYEADHLIPLAIGGNNDIANLFPESAEPKPGFKEKDVVEVFLQQEVCAGKADLRAAQKQIATDWVAVYETITPEQIKAIRSKYSNWAN